MHPRENERKQMTEDQTKAALLKAHDLKLAAEKAATDAQEAKDEAMAAMSAAKLTTAQVEDTDVLVVATVVRPTTSKVDESKLYELLNEDQWEAITERKLVKSLLAEAVDTGIIDPEVVTEATTFGEGTPHIRWTAKVQRGLKRWTPPAKRERKVRKA
jgi:hypothetical protein